jgi:mannose-6-phosphate isomerase
VSCKYFTTNILEFNRPIEKDYYKLDSFVIYITLEGNFEIETEEGTEKIGKGETVLIPANIEHLKLNPQNGKVKLLEVYIQ